MNENENEPNRREWLYTCARYAMLAGITGGAAVLLCRGGKSAAEDCRKRIPCGHCPALARCNLPQAVAFRSKARRRK